MLLTTSVLSCAGSQCHTAILDSAVLYLHMAIYDAVLLLENHVHEIP